MDTIEQTIEQLLSTVRNLAELADKAINNVNVGSDAVCMRKELDTIMERHHNQY